jgi:glucan phosphorylase
MVYRMKSTHPGVMMPELGRVTVHQEGIELISEWINSL